GTPSGARGLATPADKTEIAQPAQLATLQGRAVEPPEVTAPQASPVSESAVVNAPPRRFPAVLALLLVVLAAAFTLFAYFQTRGPAAAPETALVVPPPPQRSPAPPTPVEPPKPAVEPP